MNEFWMWFVRPVAEFFGSLALFVAVWFVLWIIFREPKK